MNPKPRITAPFGLPVTYAKSSCIFEGMIVMVLYIFPSKTVIKKKKKVLFFYCKYSRMTLSPQLQFFFFWLCKRGHLQHLLDALWLMYWDSFPVLIVSFMGLPTGLCFWAPITLLVTSSSTPLWWTMKKGHNFSSTKEEMVQ